MDFFPQPTDGLPGIKVPLPEALPMSARPDLQTSADAAVPSHQSSNSSDGNSESHQLQGSNAPSPQLHRRETTWGEILLIDPTSDDDPPPEDRDLRQDWHQVQVEKWYAFARCNRLIAPQKGPISVLLDQPILRFASLFQSWAFFGLVALMSGMRIREEDWRARADPAGRVHYVHWPNQFKRYFTPKGDDVTEATWPFESQEAMSGVLAACHQIEKSDLALASPVAEITLSVLLLCQSLVPVGNHVAGNGHRYMTKLMLSRGWCPSIIHRALVTRDNGLFLAYYLYQLRTRQSQQVSHVKCTELVCEAHHSTLATADDTGHNGSSADPQTRGYVSRHSRASCQCKFLGVDTAHICRIIDSGNTPLIQMRERAGNITLIVTEARPLDEYFAVSHVWSDGLGNPKQNALPECQVRALWQLCRRLPDPVSDSHGEGGLWRAYSQGESILGGAMKLSYSKSRLLRPRLTQQPSVLFWMDTLCIPVGPGAEITRLKEEAIDRMNFVYAAATRILVLDHGLSMTRLSTSYMLEICARIVVCPWMSRSWTYQEGALGGTVDFACADGSVNIQLLSAFAGEAVDNRILKTLSSHRDLRGGALSKVQRDELWSSARGFWSKLGLILDDPKPIRSIALNVVQSQLIQGFRHCVSAVLQKHSESRLDKFVKTWNELARRSTTVPDDLYLIFANLLDFSPVSLLKYQRQQRMQALLWSMEKLPIDILYIYDQRAQSATHSPNRWIPTAPSRTQIAQKRKQQGKTKLSHTNLTSDAIVDTMRIGDEGVLVSAQIAPNSLLVLFDKTFCRQSSMFLEWSVGEWLKLSPIIADNDQFDDSISSKICVLMDSPGNRHSVPGARLYITDGYAWNSKLKRSRDMEISAFYDCPLSIAKIDAGDIPADADRLTYASDWQTLCHPYVDWLLRISCEPFDSFQALIPRPSLDSETMRDFITLYEPLPAFLLLLFGSWFISLILQILIAVHYGWHGTSGLYKAWLILPWAICTPVPQYLFLADRLKNGDLRAIDKAYVIISVGSYVASVLAIVVIAAVANYLPHKAWRRSFDKDWPASQSTWQYRITWGLLNRVSPHESPRTTIRKFAGRIQWSIIDFLLSLSTHRLSCIKNLVDRLIRADGIYPSSSEYLAAKAASSAAGDDRPFSRQCAICSEQIMFHDECIDCDSGAFDICVACGNKGNICKESGHCLRRYQALRTTDQDGSLPEGWAALRKGTSVAYVECETGKIRLSRPPNQGASGAQQVSSPSYHLALDRGRLCLSRNSEGDAQIIWNCTT